MITFEKQNNIEVAAIDVARLKHNKECLTCVFIINSKNCIRAKCNPLEREDKRNVFFLSVYDKKILDYKAK